MKISEIRSLDKNTLNEKLTELKKELIKINAQIAIGTTPKNPGQVREIKKTIARLNSLKIEVPNQNKTKEVEKKYE